MKSSLKTILFLTTILGSTAIAAPAILTIAPPEGTKFAELTVINVAGLPDTFTAAADKYGRIVMIETAKIGQPDALVYTIDVDGKNANLAQAGIDQESLFLTANLDFDMPDEALKITDLVLAMKSAGLVKSTAAFELKHEDGVLAALKSPHDGRVATVTYDIVQIGKMLFAVGPTEQAKVEICSILPYGHNGYKVAGPIMIADAPQVLAVAEGELAAA